MYQGYAANLVETVGKNGSVITDYQYEQNNYSDSQFLKDSFARTGVQDESITVVADGAYSGMVTTGCFKSSNSIKILPFVAGFVT
ncbi:MAG: hypothetical protein MRZ75_07845 [Roseburia sp.]|nr:hypothetical protein [Roseburia sp.]MDY5884181.1 hypothetical protein [Roseburia sp.]